MQVCRYSSTQMNSKERTTSRRGERIGNKGKEREKRRDDTQSGSEDEEAEINWESREEEAIFQCLLTCIRMFKDGPKFHLKNKRAIITYKGHFRTVAIKIWYENKKYSKNGTNPIKTIIVIRRSRNTRFRYDHTHVILEWMKPGFETFDSSYFDCEINGKIQEAEVNYVRSPKGFNALVEYLIAVKPSNDSNVNPSTVAPVSNRPVNNKTSNEVSTTTSSTIDKNTIISKLVKMPYVGNSAFATLIDNYISTYEQNRLQPNFIPKILWVYELDSDTSVKKTNYMNSRWSGNPEKYLRIGDPGEHRDFATCIKNAIEKTPDNAIKWNQDVVIFDFPHNMTNRKFWPCITSVIDMNVTVYKYQSQSLTLIKVPCVIVFGNGPPPNVSVSLSEKLKVIRVKNMEDDTITIKEFTNMDIVKLSRRFDTIEKIKLEWKGVYEDRLDNDNQFERDVEDSLYYEDAHTRIQRMYQKLQNDTHFVENVNINQNNVTSSSSIDNDQNINNRCNEKPASDDRNNGRSIRRNDGRSRR